GRRKSQLAIEYSYRVREESAGTWVFWVHACSAARFNEGYAKIASRMKIPGHDKPEANILQLVSNWLSDESNGRWLMIVDNADSQSVFFNQSARQDDASCSLVNYMPQSKN